MLPPRQVSALRRHVRDPPRFSPSCTDEQQAQRSSPARPRSHAARSPRRPRCRCRRRKTPSRQAETLRGSRRRRRASAPRRRRRAAPASATTPVNGIAMPKATDTAQISAADRRSTAPATTPSPASSRSGRRTTAKPSANVCAKRAISARDPRRQDRFRLQQPRVQPLGMAGHERTSPPALPTATGAITSPPNRIALNTAESLRLDARDRTRSGTPPAAAARPPDRGCARR